MGGREKRERIAEEIKKVVDEVYKNAETGIKWVRKGVEKCSMWDLSVGLGDVSESFGYVIALEKLCNKLGIEIPEETKKKMREIKGMHFTAYRLRDRFQSVCTCTIRKQS